MFTPTAATKFGPGFVLTTSIIYSESEECAIYGIYNWLYLKIKGFD